MREEIIVRDREFSDILDVTILDMKDGKVSKVEIEGMDGVFVKAEEKADKEPPSELAAKKPIDGDLVRIISGGGERPLIGYENGETYRVDSSGSWGYPNPHERVRIVGGGTLSGYAEPEQLEIVGKSKYVGDDCDGEPLYTGDYVVGVSEQYRITDTSMTLGKVEEDVELLSGYFSVKVVAHSKAQFSDYLGETFSVNYNHFRKATAEEIRKHA